MMGAGLGVRRDRHRACPNLLRADPRRGDGGCARHPRGLRRIGIELVAPDDLHAIVAPACRDRRTALAPSEAVAHALPPTKGLERRSAPMVDRAPWPQMKTVLSSSTINFWRIEGEEGFVIPIREIRAPDRSAEQIIAENPEAHLAIDGKTTCPGVCPGQCNTSKVWPAITTMIAFLEPAIGHERPRIHHPVACPCRF